MTIVNEIRNNGYTAYILNIVALTKQQQKICLFMFLLTVILFSKNIQRNFIPTLPFENIEMTIAAVNYIRQYKLTFS